MKLKIGYVYGNTATWDGKEVIILCSLILYAYFLLYMNSKPCSYTSTRVNYRINISIRVNYIMMIVFYDKIKKKLSNFQIYRLMTIFL